MDELNQRLDQWLSTPVGGLIGFALVFLIRYSISAAQRARRRHHARNRKPKPAA